MQHLTFTKVSERTINVGPERHLITVEPIPQQCADGSGPYVERAQFAEAEAIAQQLVDARILLRAFEDARPFDGLGWVVVNGNEVHDHAATYDKAGARTGNTPNRIAKVEYPYGDPIGQAKTAALFAASPKMLAALQWAAGMAEEAITVRESGDDPEDTPAVIAMHRERLAEVTALIATLGAA